MLKMIGAVLFVVVVAAIVIIGVLVNVRRRRQSAIAVAQQLASAPNAEFATMKRAADAVALLTADRLAAGRLGCFARATLAPPESDRVQSGLEQLLRAVESGHVQRGGFMPGRIRRDARRKPRSDSRVGPPCRPRRVGGPAGS